MRFFYQLLRLLARKGGQQHIQRRADEKAVFVLVERDFRLDGNAPGFKFLLPRDKPDSPGKAGGVAEDQMPALTI